MRSNINLPLAAGLILNLVRLLIIHTDTEKWLREHWKLPTWFWHLVGGVACALMLLGFIMIAMKPERLEALRQWKQNLFGG